MSGPPNKYCGDFGGINGGGEPCGAQAGKNTDHFGTGLCSDHEGTQKNRGRPSIYDEAIATEILDRMAHGEPLRAICREDGFPSAPAVIRWANVDEPPGFAERYARARAFQVWSWVEEGLQIADDGRADFYTDSEGRVRADHEHIQRSKLRVDYRKWMASKLLPKEFGDRVAVEHSGQLDTGVMRVPESDADWGQAAQEHQNRLAALAKGNGSRGNGDGES